MGVKSGLKFAKSMREYVDTDYWHKLDEAQTEWLTAFLESEYNARPLKDAPKEDKSRSYRRKYIARSDLYSYYTRAEMEEMPLEKTEFTKKRRNRSSKITMLLVKTLKQNAA